MLRTAKVMKKRRQQCAADRASETAKKIWQRPRTLQIEHASSTPPERPAFFHEGDGLQPPTVKYVVRRVHPTGKTVRELAVMSASPTPSVATTGSEAIPLSATVGRVKSRVESGEERRKYRHLEPIKSTSLCLRPPPYVLVGVCLLATPRVVAAGGASDSAGQSTSTYRVPTRPLCAIGQSWYTFSENGTNYRTPTADSQRDSPGKQGMG